jgi:coniferyl-aldehyde dehydrogenase
MTVAAAAEEPTDTMAYVLATQRTAFTAELPVPLKIRRDRLRRLIAMVADNAERFATALCRDFGHRSREQSMLTDVVGSVGPAKHALAYMDRWVRPEKRRLQFPLGLFGARAWIEYQPKGVVGVISPWNFPVQLTASPIAGAFAAGNRVMVKTSELTPIVAALFEEIAPRYFDRAELAFFSGGPDAGERFASLPFDHLIFTGATSIGRHILRAAAANLVPVTLELGGKSPTVIGRSADFKMAVDRIALGKMLNAGQICLAPDYVFVPQDTRARFVDAMRSAVADMYPALLANRDYSAVLNQRHHRRLSGYLDDARTKGADIIEINPAHENFSASSMHKMPLYLLLDATDEMAVMQQEVFGPILPVLSYDRFDEVIDYVNAHERPLALYYFGNDEVERRRLLDRTITGGVTLNDVIFHAGIDDLPFGGIGPSGMGNYHGIDGFRTFSHVKAIYKQAWLDLNKLGGIRPPYGKTTAATVARALRR